MLTSSHKTGRLVAWEPSSIVEDETTLRETLAWLHVCGDFQIYAPQ